HVRRLDALGRRNARQQIEHVQVGPRRGQRPREAGDLVAPHRVFGLAHLEQDVTDGGAHRGGVPHDASSSARNAAPYRRSLTSPTPGTSSISSSELGLRTAISRRVRSLKTTYAGTP